MNLAESSFWDEIYSTLPLGIAHHRRPVRRWIEQWVPPCGGDCLEIGCYPGRYLAVFGELGYRLSGIDLTNLVTDRLPDWLGIQGYRVGKFHCQDFFQFIELTEETYDIVCSFGFIEHYHEWANVLEAHARLVKPGGLLLVSVPNFNGFVQRRLREMFDFENLARHNLDAMRPEEWSAVLAKHDFETLFSGSFGRFDFWIDTHLVTWWQRLGFLGVKGMIPLMRCLPVSDLYAPHCGIVARKKET